MSGVTEHCIFTKLRLAVFHFDCLFDFLIFSCPDVSLWLCVTICRGSFSWAIAERAHLWWVRTYGRDYETESVLNMYTCCRQQVWIFTLLLSHGLHLLCKTRELNRGRIHKTRTIHCTNTTPVLKKKVCSLSLSSSRMSGLWKLSPSLASVTVQNFALRLPLHCTLPLRCSLQVLLLLPSWFVHREKCSHLSNVHWFHSACTSVSMFAINADNCLFLCSCLRVHV